MLFGYIKKLHQACTLRHFNMVARELTRISYKQNSPVKVLDIGCGNGWYWKTGRLGELVETKVVELHVLEAAVPPESLAKISKVHQGKAPEALAIFKTNDFDFITTFDLIEHFPKHEGYQLLYELDRIAKHGSSVFTPNGFIWQPDSLNNKFNAHLSGWTPRELRKLGWKKQYSAGGLKFLHGAYGKLKVLNNGKMYFVTDLISNLIGNLHSDIGFAFLAISRKKLPRENYQNFSN